MNTLISRGLWGVLCVGGLSVLGATAANAAETTGDDGTASGTQAVINIELPVTLSGNALGVLGDSSQEAAPGAAPATPTVDVAPPSTSGLDAILGGTQALLNVAVPITVSGNAIGVAGDTAVTESGTDAGTPAAGDATAVPAAPAMTDGSDSIASGTQVVPTITAPITVGGNAIGVLGNAERTGTDAAAPATAGDATAVPTAPAMTDGSDGIASGTQVAPTVTAPITVGGNAIGVLGDSSNAATTGTTGTGSPTITTGDDGLLGGTQLLPTLDVPVTIGGNAIGVLGDAETTAPAASPAEETPTEEAPADGVDPEPGTAPGEGTQPGETPITAGSDDGMIVLAATAAMPVTALAATGGDAGGIALLAALLLAAGIATMAALRMRARTA